MAQEVVPMKWLIGLRTRSKTDKLAYFTYLEKNGKINSEPSWQHWRDSKIKAIEFDNDLVEGWKIDNDYNQRYGQSNRKLFIIIEPRTGYMFELDIKDILPMLQNIVIKNGIIQGKYCLTKTKTLMSEAEFKKLSSIEKFSEKTMKVGHKIAFGKEAGLGIYNVYLGKKWEYELKKHFKKTDGNWDYIDITEKEVFCFVQYKNNEINAFTKAKLPKECINVGEVSPSELVETNKQFVVQSSKWNDIQLEEHKFDNYKIELRKESDYPEFWQFGDKLYQTWYRPKYSYSDWDKRGHEIVIDQESKRINFINNAVEIDMKKFDWSTGIPFKLVMRKAKK